MQKKESTDKFTASMIYLCLVTIIQNDRFLLSNPSDRIDVDNASKWSVGVTEMNLLIQEAYVANIDLIRCLVFHKLKLFQYFLCASC